MSIFLRLRRRLILIMIKVSITKQGNYPVKSSVIKKKLADFFVKNGIVSEASVSIAIVGEKKMFEVGKKHPTSPELRGASKKLHNVLSFTPSEAKGNFVYTPDGVIYLGEIIVCFPVAVKEAGVDNVLVNEKVYELIEHGAQHLMGIHHEM